MNEQSTDLSFCFVLENFQNLLEMWLVDLVCGLKHILSEGTRSGLQCTTSMKHHSVCRWLGDRKTSRDSTLSERNYLYLISLFSLFYSMFNQVFNHDYVTNTEKIYLKNVH